MMTTIESYVRRGRVTAKKWVMDPRVRLGAKVSGYFGSGLVLSLVSLAHAPMPFAMGALMSLGGWQAAVLAVGGVLGYLIFWGQAGYQGLLWLGLALPVALALSRRRILEDSPLLMTAIGALIVSASGLAFQIWRQDTTSVGVYLLRVVLGGGSVKLFQRGWRYWRWPSSRSFPVSVWVIFRRDCWQPEARSPPRRWRDLRWIWRRSPKRQ